MTLLKNNIQIMERLKCPHCDKTYANEENLQKHIDEKHQDLTNELIEYSEEEMILIDYFKDFSLSNYTINSKEVEILEPVYEYYGKSYPLCRTCPTPLTEMVRFLYHKYQKLIQE